MWVMGHHWKPLDRRGEDKKGFASRRRKSRTIANRQGREPRLFGRLILERDLSSSFFHDCYEIMRYTREEIEDYDSYGYEGGEEEYGAEGQEYGDEEDGYGEEEEQEEQKVHQPTREELEYLKLRQLLKESIRKKMKKENGIARKDSNQNNKLPYDNNYGSFFGPTQPVISQRVIQEGKSLIENQHLMSKGLSKPLNSSKDKIVSNRSTSTAHKVFPKVRSEQESKVEKLKNTRDYSFLLSDDNELPAAPKQIPTKSVSVPSSDARPAQLPRKHKQIIGSGTTKQFHNGHDSRRPVSSLSGRVHPKPGSVNKIASNSKQIIQPMDSRKKQLGSNNGVGPGRPMGAKPLPSKASPTMENRASTHVMKNSTNSVKTSTHDAKNSINGMQRPTSKLQSAVSKQPMDQRKDLRLPGQPKIVARQNVPPPRLQITKPLKQHPSSHPPTSQQPKKKLKMDPAILEIRKMFGYDPGRYEDGDDDDRDMEANFDDIVREERRSAQIAAQEDEEELRKIQEEERRERMRKMKKRKLGAY